MEDGGVDVRQRHFAARDGRRREVAGALDVVAADPDRRAAQARHALHDDAVCARARNLRAHRIEQDGKVLDMRLAGGVVDFRRALGERGRHQDVLRRGDAGFVQHDERPRKSARRLYRKDAPTAFYLRAERFKTFEVGIQAAMPDAVATGRRQGDAARAGEERSREQHRRANGASQRRIEPSGLETPCFDPHRMRGGIACHLRAEARGAGEHVRHIRNVRHVFKRHRIGSQERRRNHRQCGVLVARHAVRASHGGSSFDEKFPHG